MIFKDLTAEITTQLVRDFAELQSSARAREYQARYNELVGDVLCEGRVENYWPILSGEDPEQYKDRRKIWIPWAQLISRRMASVCLSGKVVRKFEPIADANKGEADRANLLIEKMDEECDWDARAHDVYYHALALGEISLWPEFRMYNREDGQAYKVAGGQGFPCWTSWFPWFVEPVVHYEYSSEIIGAIKTYWTDGQMMTPFITKAVGMSGHNKSVVEVWLAPQFNSRDGSAVTSGYFKKFMDEKLIFDFDGADKWSESNPYGCCPVVFFRAPDPDESGYRGKSYVDRFWNLALEHSRTISTIGHYIDLLPNVWVFGGEKADAEKIKIRPNEVVAVPPAGTFGQAARNMNAVEEWNLAGNLAKFIGLAAQFPVEVLTQLDGAGKVESGVALKILFHPIVEGMQAIRASFGKTERERMRVSVMMFNAENPTKRIKLENIRPEIEYNEDLIPADDAQQIINDILLFDKGALSLKNIVMKYNPSITTEEQADTFLTERKREEQRAQQQTARRFPSFREKIGQNNIGQESNPNA
jgi:hypothetical protein